MFGFKNAVLTAATAAAFFLPNAFAEMLLTVQKKKVGITSMKLSAEAANEQGGKAAANKDKKSKKQTPDFNLFFGDSADVTAVAAGMIEAIKAAPEGDVKDKLCEAAQKGFNDNCCPADDGSVLACCPPGSELLSHHHDQMP